MPGQKKQPKFQFELKPVNEFLRVHYDDIQRFCEMLNTRATHKIDEYEFAGEITKKFITEDTINKYDTSNPRASFNTWIQNILKHKFGEQIMFRSQY